MTEKSANIFVVAWDMYGLECVLDATELEKQVMWDALANKRTASTIARTISAIMMRARVNTQRCYEVYSIHTQSNISSADVTDMFDRDPQCAAETIRMHGTKLYSDRSTKKQAIS